MEMAFFTTKEMMNSLESLLVAYEAAGYIDASSEDADVEALLSRMDKMMQELSDDDDDDDSSRSDDRQPSSHTLAAAIE